MRTIIFTSLLLGLSAFFNSASAQSIELQPLTTFGTNGDGSIRPGDVDYLDSTNELQRGIAWNPVTGHVLVVCRTNAVSPADPRILILDGATGTNAGTLDMSALTPLGGNPSFLINLIGVADDGAIYAGNLSNAQQPAQYRLYRWDNEAAPQALVYAGDPSNGDTNAINRRWGDTMDVRGAGTNTQVLIASRGKLAAVLRATDSSMSAFAATTLSTDMTEGSLGYGLAFGAGDTFWGTSGANGGGPLLHLSFNLDAGTATNLQTFNSTVFPNTVSPIQVLASSNWLAGIDTRSGPDLVRLYDISNLANPPALLDRQPWVLTNNNPNFAGSLAFTTNNLLYALDSDNGIMAFSVVPVSTNPLPPSVFLSPASLIVLLGSNVTFTAAADGSAPLSYQWRFNATNIIAGATGSSITLTNAQLTNSGAYTVVVTNLYGSATSSIASLHVVAELGGALVYEPFNYSPGQLLTTANTNYVLNGTTTNDTAVVPGNLSIPGLALPNGNSITNGGVGAAARLPLNTSFINGSLYYSFAMRVNSVGTAFTSTASFLAAFINAGANEQEARLMPRTNTIPGQYNLGVTKVTSASPVWATNDFVEGETVFIVCGYTFNTASSTDDAVAMWINPDPSTFGAAASPTPTLVATVTGADITSIDQFAFRQNTAANTPASITFDELRIGTDWASVTPPQAPSLSIVPSGTNVVISWPTNSSDFVLQGTLTLVPSSWSPVTNSQGISGTNYAVTIKANSGNRFFRLAK